MTDHEPLPYAADAPLIPPAGGDPAVIDKGPSAADEQAAGGERREEQWRMVDQGLGVVRVGVGLALVAAPRWAGRIWVGPGADGPGSAVFARAVGARDVALGVRILTGLSKGEPVRHWVVSGFVSDAADVAATLIAGRHLTPGRRVAMPFIAAAVGAAGYLSSRQPAGS